MSGIFISVFILGLFGCQKQQDWLEARVNINSVVPSRLEDYQALLDLDDLYQSQGSLSQLSNNQFYMSEADYNAISTPLLRNAIVWAERIYEGATYGDWEAQYKMISVSNVCLEGLRAITRVASNQLAYDQVKGTAHFFRGFGYFNLLQLFAKTYDPATASTDLGVPLRLESDINVRPGRSSVKTCYDQVLSDLHAAIALLPSQSDFQIRPTKKAAKAILAKLYQLQENWTLAAQLSQEVIQEFPTLLDFNSVNANATVPFPTLQTKHPEIFLYREMDGLSIYLSNIANVDSVLYQSYATNDLRRSVFYRLFNGKPLFKGFYTGLTATAFGGLASNEMYLIRAESLARLGNVSGAMLVLNQLLIRRWRTGSFVPYTATDANDALDKILMERRKELPFTGDIIWTDLRRLNRDPRYARTLKRVMGNRVFELAPNSLRYVFPIPDAEIKLTGIPQNPR